MKQIRFQTTPEQTEELLQVIKEFAGEQGIKVTSRPKLPLGLINTFLLGLVVGWWSCVLAHRLIH